MATACDANMKKIKNKMGYDLLIKKKKEKGWGGTRLTDFHPNYLYNLN